MGLFPKRHVVETKNAYSHLFSRKQLLVVPINIKMLLISTNIRYCTLLVLSRALYRALYLPCYCPFLGIPYCTLEPLVRIGRKQRLRLHEAFAVCRPDPTRSKKAQTTIQQSLIAIQ